MIKFPQVSVLGVVLVSLSACQPGAGDPRETANRFWLSMKTGNTEEARRLVTRDSLPSLDSYLNQPEAGRTPIDEVNLGTAETRVVTVIYPDALAPDDRRAFDTYLLLENGQWKVDAARSTIPQASSISDRQLEELADELSESMHQNLESMQEAMSEGLDLLNEALREGSKDMGESLLNGLEEMNRAMRESIEEMRKRREQPPPPPAAAPGGGEGLI